MKISSPSVRISIAAALGLITVQLVLAAGVLSATGHGTAGAICFVGALLLGPAACQATLDLR